MHTPVLAASGLNTFYGPSHILRDVSFHVGTRETVSLLGRNGMGKTTLLRTLMGLVRPRSGAITLHGEDVTGARANTMARAGLALVPENCGNQLSGGEQQMLTIGRALMSNPDIVLVDEATEGLAPKVRDDIWRTLRVIASNGVSIVVVDKNLKDLLALSDRHVILAKGAI